MKKLLVLPVILLFIGFVSCSDDDNKENEAAAMMEELGEILSYENVELKMIDSDTDDYGIGFSVTTGEIYKQSEVNEENIAQIDLVSFANQAFISFNSPDRDNNFKEIEGVKSTLIQIANVEMTAEEFDSIEDDTLLKDLSVTHDNETQRIDYRGVFLFKTAEDKIGAIKVNLLNAERISIDVKVMK